MSRSQHASADPVPVVIVGAGPAGVTAATLLGQYGVDCLVLDRWDGVYPQPRAVHLDDEIYRILARLGIAEQFAAVSRPTRGLQLIDRNHRVFAVFDRPATTAGTGTRRANMFDQPELEHLLRTNLKDQTTVTPARQRRGHRRRPGRPGPGPGRLHRPAHRRARVRAGHLRPGLRRSQQRGPHGDRLDHGGPRRSSSAGWSSTSPPRSSSTSGKASTRSATPTAPRPTCAIGETRYRWEFRLLRRARPRPTSRPSRPCSR